MPIETPIAPPQAAQPAGTFSKQQKRWIYVALIGGAVLLMILSAHSTSTTAMAPRKPKPAVKTTPADLSEKPPTKIPPGQPPPTQQASAQPQYAPMYQPQQTQQDQLKADRARREQEAAYADSVVKRPEPTKETLSPHAADQSAQQRTAVESEHAPILPEGTIINATLENRLNGDYTGPVKALIATDVYLPGTDTLVIPQGAEVHGEAIRVSGFGQERLAVMFHRITWLPDHSVSLDKVPALDQEGAAALPGKVNNHYGSIFGASLAIGAIGGLAQIGNGYSGFGYDPSAEMRNGITQSMGQSAYRILDRFLTRNPTIKVPEGTPITILLMGDVPLSNAKTLASSR